MCSPVASSSMGLQIFGALSSANAAKANAQSQQEQLNYTANLAEINARTSESQAQQTLLAGQREEQKLRISTSALKGSQRVALAANGVDLGVGSAAQILTTTDVLGEIDANTIQANAIKSAWGYRAQASNQTSQAMSSRAAASAISPSSAFASSLLGSSGQVASSWYAFDRQGAWDKPKPK